MLTTHPNAAVDAILATLRRSLTDAETQDAAAIADATREAIRHRIEIAGADYMLLLFKAETWGDLVLTIDSLDRVIAYLSAVRDSGLERERTLAQP